MRTPVIPNRACNIQKYGAVPDGRTLNTDAIARAIDACAKAGGGRVVIPAGIWLTGPIELKNRIDLHVDRGALVLFSPDFSLYPLQKSSYEGLDGYRCASPIFGRNLTNIAITGEGVFDGSGQAWRPVKKSKLTAGQWKALVESGGVLDAKRAIWYPSAAARDGFEILSRLQANGAAATLADHEKIRDFLRPVLLQLTSCRRVLLDGPTFQNSPAWCLHPLLCEDVTVRNVTVRNPWYSQNGDGIDLESCRNVIVANSRFDVGDDAICLKSGRDAAGRQRGKPTENVRIRDCVVFHGHGGFVIGSEMSGGVRRVDVRDCTFIGTDTGLRFKSRRGRGGVVEDISIRGIRMINIATQAIVFDLFYGGLAPEDEEEDDGGLDTTQPPAANEETPRFERIHIRDVIVRGARQALLMRGLPEMPLRDIDLAGVSLTSDQGAVLSDVEGIRLLNVEILNGRGPVVTIKNGRGVTLERARYARDAELLLDVSGSRSADIIVSGTDLTLARKDVQLSNGAPEGAVARRP